MIMHPYSWIEIDHQALAHNVKILKHIIGNKSLAPVIKSNGYGHGIDTMGLLLDTMSEVSMVCVGYLTEAITLKKKGVQKPILVMSCIDDDPAHIGSWDIHFIVSDMQKIIPLHDAWQRTGIIFKVHLKIDTGLSRFGIIPERVTEMITYIKRMNSLNLVGVCTHFAESHKQDQTFTRLQKKVFGQVVNSLVPAPVYIHASNSASTLQERFEGSTIFRVGLSLYGYWPTSAIQHHVQNESPHVSLIPVLTWKTRIMEVRTVKKGVTIGYDRTFTAPENMTIALLPVGYFDGYDFRLCNNSLVYIDDKPFKVIGKIAMNTLCVDITTHPHFLSGIQVVLLGNKSGITAHDFCDRIGEYNPRKILATIASHLPRIIV